MSKARIKQIAMKNAMRVWEVTHIEQLEILILINSKLESNSVDTKELSTYLLIDAEEVDHTIQATYWISNCDIANQIPYGTNFSPLKSTPVKKGASILLKATTGGKTSAKRGERMEAYKYALTTRDQLFSIMDISNKKQLLQHFVRPFSDIFSTLSP